MLSCLQLIPQVSGALIWIQQPTYVGVVKFDSYRPAFEDFIPPFHLIGTIPASSFFYTIKTCTASSAAQSTPSVVYTRMFCGRDMQWEGKAGEAEPPTRDLLWYYIVCSPCSKIESIEQYRKRDINTFGISNSVFNNSNKMMLLNAHNYPCLQ